MSLTYPKPMVFQARMVKPVYRPSVRDLCTKRYHNHPKGCPNYNVRCDCPPNVPLLPEIFDTGAAFWALWAEFDLGAHVSKMRAAHPGWKWPQLVCCLYWQGTVRKFLRNHANEWMANYAASCSGLIQASDIICTEGPEAIGVDVTATMKQLGVQLEWPPKQIVSKVILLGVKK